MPNARHRPRSGRPLRPRGPEGPGRRPALHGRPRPRAAGHERASASTGTRPPGSWARATAGRASAKHHVVAIDYGVKRNILRLLARAGCKVTVVPGDRHGRGHAGAEARRRLPLERPRRPGRDRRIRRAGDPDAARAAACRPSASASATRCSASRSAARTMKMHQGHHGANHPVKDKTTGKVEITSMNHGFAVDPGEPARQRGRDARLAVRRLQLRHRAHRPAGLLGAVPPGSLARARRTATTCSTAS